jgi:hypothetical protein
MNQSLWSNLADVFGLDRKRFVSDLEKYFSQCKEKGPTIDFYSEDKHIAFYWGDNYKLITDSLQSVFTSLNQNISTSINELKKKRDNIKKESENNFKKLNLLKQQSVSNPDQFKQDYYEDSYVNNLLNGFSTVKIKREIKDSPLTKVLQWEEDMNFKRSNENWDRIMDKDASARGWRTIALSEDQNQREWFKFEAEYTIDPITGRYVKVETPKKTNPISTETISEINSENQGDPIDAEASYRNITLDLKNSAQNKGFDLVYTYLNKLNNDREFKAPLSKDYDIITKYGSAYTRLLNDLE